MTRHQPCERPTRPRTGERQPGGMTRRSLLPLALLLALAAPCSTATLGPVVVTAPRYALRLTSIASYYTLEGHTQADGQPHRGRRLTAAHRTLPLGSVRTLCREDRPLVCVTVRVEDRGPWIEGREWDLSRAAARRLGMLRQGLVGVIVRGE